MQQPKFELFRVHFVMVANVAGSAWMILSRGFVDYVVWGWDNLPRILLLYYANFVSSPENYFHTVICNVPEFATATVNSDLRYISWDIPPKQHPHTLSINDIDKMIASGAAFARKFKKDDIVLDVIDKNLLNRMNGSFTPGGWCSDEPICSKVGNVDKLKPGPGSQRLGQLVARLTLTPEFTQKQCK